MGGRPVIADQSVMVVQRDHAVAQTLQHLLRSQMAKIVAAAAPHHNHHHGHGDRQRYRGEVEHLNQLEYVGCQYHNRQRRNPQNRPILTADLLIRAQTHRPRQSMYGKHIGNYDTGNHKKDIQRAVRNTDIVKTLCRGEPLHFPVEKAVPVKKYCRQHKEVDKAQAMQQLFRRTDIAVSVCKPAIAQRNKGGAHVFHRHSRHGSLHSGSNQLQKITHVLHQRTGHNKNQQLLLTGSVSVDQKKQCHENQAYTKKLQPNNKTYHFCSPIPCLYFVLAIHAGQFFPLLTIIYFPGDVKK